MADYTIPISVAELRELMRCTTCLEPSCEQPTTCTSCENALCTTCTERTEGKCPFKCGATVKKKSHHLRNLAGVLKKAFQRDGRPIDCGGGSTFKTANKLHARRYQGSRAKFDSVTKQLIRNRLRVISDARTLIVRLQVTLEASLREQAQRELEARFETYICEQGRGFSNVAESIQNSTDEDEARQIATRTAYFTMGHDGLVDNCLPVFNVFTERVIHLAYVHAKNGHNPPRSKEDVFVNYDAMQPMLQSGDIPSLIKEGLARDDSLVVEGSLTEMHKTFLIFLCFLHLAQKGPAAKDTLDLHFRMLEDLDCGFTFNKFKSAEAVYIELAAAEEAADTLIIDDDDDDSD